jgi:hypothetical protein
LNFATWIDSVPQCFQDLYYGAVQSIFVQSLSVLNSPRSFSLSSLSLNLFIARQRLGIFLRIKYSSQIIEVAHDLYTS